MVIKSKNGQAMPSQIIPMESSVLDIQDKTSIYWLANASLLINSHGTCLMIDPLLKGFDMPLLVQSPMKIEDISRLDAICITHIDNDHFSRQTCQALKMVCQEFHAPNYVGDVMRQEGYHVYKHDIDDEFMVGNIKMKLTPAWHNWQNESQKWQYRHWERKDYCGYWMETMDGTIWLPGDSRLLEEHLNMPEPDVILFDFSDNDWHITLNGAIKLANTYVHSDLICIHWGSVDAAQMSPFNGNPEVLFDKIVNPERIKVLYPGQEYQLEKDRQ